MRILHRQGTGDASHQPKRQVGTEASGVATYGGRTGGRTSVGTAPGAPAIGERISSYL